MGENPKAGILISLKNLLSVAAGKIAFSTPIPKD
jgi:hypothetical protein